MSNKSELDIKLQRGLELPKEQRFYFNGFTISIGPPDFTIVLQVNNEPVAHLNTTHVIAKTLAKKLTGVIDEFEKSMNYKISTLDDFEKEAKKKSARSKANK